MEIKLSKTNSLVNLSNSILKKFSCQTFHNSNDEIDRILNSKGNQVCLILLMEMLSTLILTMESA